MDILNNLIRYTDSSKPFRGKHIGVLRADTVAMNEDSATFTIQGVNTKHLYRLTISKKQLEKALACIFEKRSA